MILLTNERAVLVVAIVIAIISMYSLNVSGSPPTAKEAISEVLPNEVTGSIEGSVCYPSEDIPGGIKIYALNKSTSKIYMTPLTDKDFPNKFWFRVPVGDYHVYAMTSHATSLEGYKAYYSEFIKCGQSAKCKSHKPITVKVVAGVITSNIRPCDWYDRERLK
ncbi:MAG: hypothetical protein AABZ15_14160 [Nitrospirota bacterium]